MVGAGATIGIAVVALGLVLTPGPNMMYLVSRSVTQGRRAGLISLAGVAAGFLVYLVAATAGLTTVFTVVPALYLVVKLAGAAYLCWLAWKTLRPGGESAFVPKPLPVDPAKRLFTMGFVTNLLNPKAAVFYVAMLPEFVNVAAGDVVAQTLALSAIYVAIATTIHALIVLLASSVRGFVARSGQMKAVRRILALALVGVAEFVRRAEHDRVVVRAADELPAELAEHRDLGVPRSLVRRRLVRARVRGRHLGS